MGPDSEVFQEKCPKYLRRIDEHLNSESIEKQFGQSDAYYSHDAIINRNLAPGSMAKGKDNDREGKGTRSEGQREANCAEERDNIGGSVNHQARVEFGNEGR